MYENTREPPGVVGGVGWSGIGESGEDPGGGGVLSIFLHT